MQAVAALRLLFDQLARAAPGAETFLLGGGQETRQKNRSKSRLWLLCCSWKRKFLLTVRRHSFLLTPWFSPPACHDSPQSPPQLRHESRSRPKLPLQLRHPPAEVRGQEGPPHVHEEEGCVIPPRLVSSLTRHMTLSVYRGASPLHSTLGGICFQVSTHWLTSCPVWGRMTPPPQGKLPAGTYLFMLSLTTGAIKGTVLVINRLGRPADKKINFNCEGKGRLRGNEMS